MDLIRIYLDEDAAHRARCGRASHTLDTEWISAGREHAGMILAPQQRFSAGENLRRILRIRATANAGRMRNRIEFLTNCR